MTKIALSLLGSVDPSWASWAQSLLEKLYLKVEKHPLLVYLVIAHSKLLFKSYLMTTHLETGVASAPAFEEFEASHDAFLGAPRIVLCEESLRNLPRHVQAGVILHEGAHSVLHGELRSYTLTPPPLLRDVEAKLQAPQGYSVNLLYLFSTAVKDYEATELLLELGFREEAKDYVIYALEPSPRLVEDWKLASAAGIFLRLVHLAELLKPLCCASPLMEDGEVKTRALSMTSHLPTAYADGLVDIAASPAWRSRATLQEKLEGLAEVFLERFTA